ncbi:MAG: hypothetical protein IKX98_01385, partial [Clostridia bacterium]|nr:hypothetical protein [Clostridia bacterium]
GIAFALKRVNATPLALYRKIKWWIIGIRDPEAAEAAAREQAEAEEAAEAAEADSLGRRVHKHRKPKKRGRDEEEENWEAQETPGEE